LENISSDLKNLIKDIQLGQLNILINLIEENYMDLFVGGCLDIYSE
jgi:hypothetical protein